MTVHIIGAGLAGLTAAVTIQNAGFPTRLYDAAPRPGGRCGGWAAPPDSQWRDRGTHLILSGNTTVADLIRRYGRSEGWITLPPRFRFHDLSDGTRWELRPGTGRWPGWLFHPGRRVAGAGALAHLRALLALEISAADQVGDAVDLSSPLGRRLIAPLTVSLLNTAPDRASLPLLRRTLRDSLYRGGASVSPLLCRTSLEHDLITPLASALTSAGGEMRLRCPVSALNHNHDGLSLLCAGETIACGGDPVILAVDPAQASRLLPNHLPALPLSPILNLHYPTPESPEFALPELTGICGGHSEWILRRSNHLAVTISAAAPALSANPDLPAILWREIRQVYPALPHTCPDTARVLTERRATLLQTPVTDQLRPRTRPQRPDWPSTLWLAGDWVQTGLPCTLEGAARSGVAAAQAVLRSLRAAP